MIRTILIPTDFSIVSLRLMKEALQTVQIGKVKIILFHCIHLSDSIVDLLFFSRKDVLDSLISDDFHDASKILLSRYANRIHSLRVEIFTGATQNAFKNFILANDIDEVLLPRPFNQQLPHRDSFSPEPFIAKCGVVVTEIALPHRENAPERNTLAEIFLL